jgi:formylglycine-generating enzyme required for sulfatase activity
VLERFPIPEGDFLMGREGAREDEEPIHRVFVSSFEIAITPVTNAQYRVYLAATGAAPPILSDDPDFSHPEQPVVGVSFHDARRYCRWLSRESGLSIRLPTEAEREKAARGGISGKTFPWGEDPEGGGHPSIRGPLRRPDRVRATPPNAYGLFHMADTVHEWCLDSYLPDFYQSSPAVDPRARGGARRSARGGSWRHAIVVTPSAARSSLPPSFHYADFGFRWVRDKRP